MPETGVWSLRLCDCTCTMNWGFVKMGNQSRGNQRMSFSKKNGSFPPDLAGTREKERDFDRNFLLHRIVRKVGYTAFGCDCKSSSSNPSPSLLIVQEIWTLVITFSGTVRGLWCFSYDIIPFLVTDSDCPPIVGFFESFTQKFEIFYLFDQFHLVGCLQFTFHLFIPFIFLTYFSNICLGF